MISTKLVIGEHHTNFCEDFLITVYLENDLFLLGALDGCSSGTESHFASTLFGKTLRNIANSIAYERTFKKTDEKFSTILKRIISELFKEIKKTKNQLNLDTLELLSTVNLALVSQKTGEVVALVIGDGVIAVDEQIFEFEQNDHPDYLAYHLDENFDKWYKSLTQLVHKTNVHQ